MRAFAELCSLKSSGLPADVIIDYSHRWLERNPRLRNSLWSYVINRLTPSTPETTMTSSGAAGAVDPKLLEILVCPLTKGPLEYDADKQELVSRAAKLAYPIRDGIPIMLVDEARKLD
jgi:uncharacterized protein YbaR (Trm112 family)